MSALLRFAVVVGALSAAVLAVPGASAQAPAPANSVRVDLFAVRDGSPVRDLREDEVQLLEDDVPQPLDSFERVEVAPGSKRSRVYVVFVDTYHTSIEDSDAGRLPVVRLLDRLIERDDLVALMTPEMTAADLSFGRKAEVLSNLMQAEWTWGRRGRRREAGSKESLYDQCFGSERGAAARGAEMKARWREQMTLDALDDLVAHLGSTREERKAVLTISDGWQLFVPSKTLAEPDSESSSRSDRLRRFGDRGSRGGSPATPVMKVECEADRRRLAALDHSQRVRDVSEAANRVNASFYSFYAPEVSAGSDGAARAASSQIEHASARQDSLRLLAEGTDGFAVLRRADVDAALPKIVSDETSYYLATYHSTNTKLDGRFRTFSAKVTRPGVRVRLRRGYRGNTADELISARRPGRAVRPAAAGASAAAALDARRPFRIRTSAWTAPDGGTFWIVGELDYRTRRELAWTAGAKADVIVLNADGTELFSRTVDVQPDEGGFAIQVPERGAAQPGEYAVQVQLRPDANDSLVLSDTTSVVIGRGSANELGTPVVWRRGLSTGPRHVQTADLRFQRSERIRLEMATTVPGSATARMIDRAGQPLIVPVQVSAREDESGRFRWIVAESVLAPLAPGEYTIEVSLGTLRQSFVFSLVP